MCVVVLPPTSLCCTNSAGPPSDPVVDSLVVVAGTMDTLKATWQMPNTYTATSYSYRIWNTLDSSEAEYTDNSMESSQMTTFEQTVNGMGKGGTCRDSTSLARPCCRVCSEL